MKVELKKGYKMTSRAVEALMIGTKVSYNEYHTKDGIRYVSNGHVFSSIPSFGKWLLKEINDWMLDNNLVDLHPILAAHMAYSSSYKFFEVVE